MLVTSYDGRPIKAEGNPEHPDSLGSLSAIAQASVLGLYDPDRSRQVILRVSGQEYAKSWDDFAAELAIQVTGSGEGLAVLSEASSSPSLRRLRERLLAARPAAAWYEYEAVSHDSERDGLRAALGRPLRVVPHLDRARVVACFDADPLFEHPAAVRLARGFAESRDPHRPEGMSRLYVVEAGFTLTGGRADTGWRLASRSRGAGGADRGGHGSRGCRHGGRSPGHPTPSGSLAGLLAHPERSGPTGPRQGPVAHAPAASTRCRNAGGGQPRAC
jgi:molybdopterin-containing oxidoreductase family iron-sulfur binding subunit